jgi:hypothetical protein
MLQSSLSQLDPKLTYMLLSTVTVTLAVMAVILLGWFIYLVPWAPRRRRHPLTMEQYFAHWHRYGYADGVIYEGKDLGICPICKPSEGAVSLTMTGSLKFDDWSAVNVPRAISGSSYRTVENPTFVLLHMKTTRPKENSLSSRLPKKISNPRVR